MNALHPGVIAPKSGRRTAEYFYDEAGNRYVECSDCKRRFIRGSALNKHIRVVHKRLRDYICDICAKAFSESRDLKAHRQQFHMQQREFQCDKCGRKFGENKKLVRHVRARHPEML
jgi:KRAB domain-containing zinc finger protein